MISSLLVANRGEIARRIMRTARAMGIRTIAVHSDVDAKMPFVREADQAVCIGPAPARESYLAQAKILAAARETGAEAVHPGYGFLSENADFAEAVIAAGLVWVGAPPAAIRAMGLKDAAKALMMQAGVPVTPGYLGADQSLERLRAEADAIGYPVLIKAVAGGGGKGMRRVEAAADFADALTSCRREAASSFGDDRVLIEKYVLNPRHIEVQVFGDTHGNVVHLFERDCSLQRRHQKVIEEAPAPGMSAAVREAICSAAVKAAKAVDYVGAGTIEFIADASERLRADRIWFMEMNTRLQVEHPVTEAITGVDLVEWQLRVAAGEPLPRRQEQLAIDGWAMEARLYAEDPANGFLPSVGRLTHFRLPREPTNESYIAPATGARHRFAYPGQVRIEAAVEEGDTISSFYDPMIAKLICHADRRRDAALGLSSLARRVESWPVRTNATFLHALLVNPDFTRGAVNTGFIEDHAEDVIFKMSPPEWLIDASAEALIAGAIQPALRGFRPNRAIETHTILYVDEHQIEADWTRRRPDGCEPWISLVRDDEAIYASSQGRTWRVTQSPPLRAWSAAASDGALLAPMPGRVISVLVGEGDEVVAGQRLVVIEAMKMEQALVAPFDGMIAEVGAREGAQVAEGAVLVRVERQSAEAAGAASPSM